MHIVTPLSRGLVISAKLLASLQGSDYITIPKDARRVVSEGSLATSLRVFRTLGFLRLSLVPLDSSGVLAYSQVCTLPFPAGGTNSNPVCQPFARAHHAGEVLEPSLFHTKGMALSL